MQIFQGFFYLLKKPLVATLNETCALTSRTNVAEKGIIIPKKIKNQKIIIFDAKIL